MSLFANYRTQFLLDRLGRYLKLFVSTVGHSYHEIASHFGLAILYKRKTSKNYCGTESPASVQLNEPATPVDRQRIDLPIVVLCDAFVDLDMNHQCVNVFREDINIITFTLNGETM